MRWPARDERPMTWDLRMVLREALDQLETGRRPEHVLADLRRALDIYEARP